MQKVVRGKSYIFEGVLPEEIINVLQKWGSVVRRGEVTIFTVDSGEIKARKISDTPSSSVRRIYITSSCGCSMEIDETRNFETGEVSYAVYKTRLCPLHQI